MQHKQEWRKQFHNRQANSSTYIAWTILNVWKATAIGPEEALHNWSGQT